MFDFGALEELVESKDRVPPRPLCFTLDAVEQILRNVGVDVECGACMGIAFTGTNAHGPAHTCAGDHTLEVTFG